MGDETQACHTCKFLRECHDVTENMILEQKKCRMWAPAPAEELQARQDIANEFGQWALKYTVPKLTKPKVRKRRRRNG